MFNIPLINTHTHAPMVAFRWAWWDQPLDKWLNDYIWPLEKKYLSKDFVYKNAKIAIKEMKKNKIMAFNDMYFFEEEVAKAAIEEKMYAVIWEWLLDFETVSCKNPEKGLMRVEKLILKYKDNKYIKVAVSPHAIYTVSKDNLLKLKELSRKYNCLFHIHLSETKKEYDDCLLENNMTPIEYLNDLWILDNKTILAHCVYLWSWDYDILKNTWAHVSHCPLSNLKLWSWIAPIAKMLEYWINVTIWTDWSASSNRLDVWEAWKIAWLLQKWVNNDSTLLPSKEIIKMMTINGMKALWIEEINWKSILDYEKIIDETDSFDYLYHLNVNEI